MAKPTLFWYGCIFAMLVGAIVFIYLGVKVIQPYRITSEFKKTVCSALNVTDHGNMECTCDPGVDAEESCDSRFPCVEITVRVFRPHTLSVLRHGRLHEHYKPPTVLCSKSICDEYESTNIEEVENFVKKYGDTGSDKTYPCLYNPKSSSQVILKTPSRIGFIMAIFWPTLVMVTSFFLLCITCMCSFKRNKYSATNQQIT